MLNWLLTLEEAVLLQAVSRFLPELPLFFIDGLEMFFAVSTAAANSSNFTLFRLPSRTTRVRPLGCSRSIADGPYSTKT
jgi:hypothetical protein